MLKRMKFLISLRARGLLAGAAMTVEITMRLWTATATALTVEVLAVTAWTAETGNTGCTGRRPFCKPTDPAVRRTVALHTFETPSRSLRAAVCWCKWDLPRKVAAAAAAARAREEVARAVVTTAAG